MGADTINEQNESNKVLLQIRIETVKTELVNKLTPLLEEFKALLESSSDNDPGLGENRQQEADFFKEWQDFFDNKIKFFLKPENIHYLTDYGNKNKLVIIESLEYYKKYFLEIKIRIDKLNSFSDIKSLEAAENNLTADVRVYTGYFKNFIEISSNNPYLEIGSVEPYDKNTVKEGNPAEEAQKPCIFKEEIKIQIKNLLQEYQKYLAGYNLSNLSNRSRFVLVTKKGAVNNLLFTLENNPVDDFDSCLSGWKSTFVLHRDNALIQAIGKFFKGHSKTKGCLLLDKLEDLIEQKEVAAIPPQPN